MAAEVFLDVSFGDCKKKGNMTVSVTILKTNPKAAEAIAVPW